MPITASAVRAAERQITSGITMLKNCSVLKPTTPPTSDATAIVTPMPTREAMVLKSVKVGRCFGSFVRQVCPARVQEVWIE
jgi:hypothetical protein